MPKGNGDVKRTRKKTRVDLLLPIKALSTNKMYSGRKRRSVYYKAYRKEVFKFLNSVTKEGVHLNGNLTLHLEVGFSSPLSDLSNALKCIEDICCEYFDFDDRQIVHIEMDKFLVNKGDEYIKISIFKTKRNIDRRKNGKKIR